MDCLKCQKSQVCCKDYGVTLSNREIKKYRHKKLVPLTENNLILGYVFVLDKRDGSCIYLENNLCCIYKDRPGACRRFNCDNNI